MIAGQVGFAGSSTVGNNVSIGGQAGISGHLNIGNNVRIGGGSGVVKDVQDNSIVMGYPAVPLKEFLKKGVKNIIITLGEKGVYFANKDQEYFIEALKLKNEVVDTTGAGDAFNGAFVVGLANDLKFKDALIFANKVAGISTTKVGAANSMPTFEEVENY